MTAAVAAGAWRLHVASAGGGDHELLWATWDDVTSKRIVRLVMLRQEAGKVAALWSTRRIDSDEPTIETVLAWQFDGRSVLPFRYQLGAADMRGELYGIGADRAPTRLGEIEGSLIEVLDINGMEGPRLYDAADLRNPPTCFRWEASVHRLIRQGCHSATDGR